MTRPRRPRSAPDQPAVAAARRLLHLQQTSRVPDRLQTAADAARFALGNPHHEPADRAAATDLLLDAWRRATPDTPGNARLLVSPVLQSRRTDAERLAVATEIVARLAPYLEAARAELDRAYAADPARYDEDDEDGRHRRYDLWPARSHYRDRLLRETDGRFRDDRPDAVPGDAAPDDPRRDRPAPVWPVDGFSLPDAEVFAPGGGGGGRAVLADLGGWRDLVGDVMRYPHSADVGGDRLERALDAWGWSRRVRRPPTHPGVPAVEVVVLLPAARRALRVRAVASAGWRELAAQLSGASRRLGLPDGLDSWRACTHAASAALGAGTDVPRGFRLGGLTWRDAPRLDGVPVVVAVAPAGADVAPAQGWDPPGRAPLDLVGELDGDGLDALLHRAAALAPGPSPGEGLSVRWERPPPAAVLVTRLRGETGRLGSAVGARLPDGRDVIVTCGHVEDDDGQDATLVACWDATTGDRVPDLPPHCLPGVGVAVPLPPPPDPMVVVHLHDSGGVVVLDVATGAVSRPGHAGRFAGAVVAAPRGAGGLELIVFVDVAQFVQVEATGVAWGRPTGRYHLGPQTHSWACPRLTLLPRDDLTEETLLVGARSKTLWRDRRVAEVEVDLWRMNGWPERTLTLADPDVDAAGSPDDTPSGIAALDAGPGPALLAVSRGGAVRLHSSVTGALAGGPFPGVRVAAVPTARGDLLIAGTALHDPATGRAVCRPGADRVPTAVAALPGPDGEPLLVGTEYGEQVVTWSASSLREARPREQVGPVDRLAVVAPRDGRPLVAAAARRGTRVRVWDLATGEPLTGTAPADHPDGVGALCGVTFPDGRALLVTGSVAGAIRSWDLDTGLLVGSDAGGGCEIRSMTAVRLPGGAVAVATGSRTGVVRLVDPLTCRPLGPEWTRAGARGVRSLAVVPAGEGAVHVVTGQAVPADGGLPRVRRWDPTTGRTVGPELDIAGRVRALACVPLGDGDDRALLAIDDSSGWLRLVDLPSGERLGDVVGTGVAALGGPGRAPVLVTGHDGLLLLRDARTHVVTASYPLRRDVTALAVHRTTVVVGCPDGVVVLDVG